MRGFVLSRTEMNGGRFCTCLAVHLSDAWYQVRLMNQYGYSLRYNEVPGGQEEVIRHWILGRMVEVGTVYRATPRHTHPEDLRVDPSTISIPGSQLRRDILLGVVEGFTFDTVSGLYPDVDPYDRYVVEQDLPRSVGYVRGVRVRIYRDGNKTRAMITDGDDRTLRGVPVVGTDLLQRKDHYNREVFRTVRLSLAGSFRPRWLERDDPSRCYLQLSDIVER